MSKKTTAPPVKPSDLEKYKLKGKVKQEMRITYKAHQKDGEVIEGRIDLDDNKLNYITTYNEKGNKIKKDDFSDAFCNEDIFDEQGASIKKTSSYKGKLYSTTTTIYNKEHQSLTHLYKIHDREWEHLTVHTYTKSGKPLENKQFHPSINDLKERTVFVYDENDNMISSTGTDGEGNILSTSFTTYNSDGKRIENKSVHTDPKKSYLNSWTKSKYNKQGDCIETTQLNVDGTVKDSYTYKHQYDKEGKKIIPYHPPYIPPGEVLVPGETEIVENDAHGNWIKKTTFYKKIPIHIKRREFVYFGENEDVRLIHPFTFAPPAEETPEEIEADEPEKLSEEQVKWLTQEPMRTADNFSWLQYYALKFKEFPSQLSFDIDNVEVKTLYRELTENMKAQEVHIFASVYNGYNPETEHCTITFPFNDGYLLHICNINEEEAEEYDVPDNIGEKYDETISLGDVELLRPSIASGRRDSYFENSLLEYINKCSVQRKPDQPVINMIEVAGNTYVMAEHDVKDDFDIRDLDINYGYGFEDFHNRLMDRFENSSKGLILFHGKPGTGKTYYIRHLLRSMASGNKVVIYMPPNMVDRLIEPAFMTFLVKSVKNWSMQGKFCVLLIEDAEPLLAKRQEGVRIQGVTNLLNMTDGILNDMLNLQIICTFNVALNKLDSALLRPGRLIARKEFKPLSPLDANILAQQLGINHHFEKPATLSEIYAKRNNQNTLVHDVDEEGNNVE